MMVLLVQGQPDVCTLLIAVAYNILLLTARALVRSSLLPFNTSRSCI